MANWMRAMNLSISGRIGASAGLIAFLFGFVVVSAQAQAQAQAQSQAVESRKAAEESLRAGLAAQKGRRHDVAIREFSRAISAGSLARKQLTYALYRRAISNRAQRLPAQAISDLNGALFFKGDLSVADRADAIEERAKAFRDAGLTPTAVAAADPTEQWRPAVTGLTKPVAPARPRVVSSVPPRVLEPVEVTKPRKSSSSFSPTAPILAPTSSAAKAASVTPRSVPRFQTRVSTGSSAPQASVPPDALRPVRTSGHAQVEFTAPKVERGVGVLQQVRRSTTTAVPVMPWNVATTASPTTSRQPLVVVPSTKGTDNVVPVVPTTATEASNVLPARAGGKGATSDSGSVTQFISSLFGGAPIPKQDTSPIRTASVKKPSPVSSSAGSVNSAAKITARPPAAVESATVRAIEPPTLPLSAPRTKSGGNFEVEVAVLRNKHRADALAQQIMVQYPSSGFWSQKRTARVVASGAEDQGGVRYSVRYGMFENRSDLQATCEKFKSDGLSCDAVPKG